MLSIFRTLDIRYLINSYVWAILIFFFLQWTVPMHDMYLNVLFVISAVFFPLTRFLLHEIKNVFFGDIEIQMTIKVWGLYLVIKFFVFVGFYIFTLVFAPLGFMILLLQRWIAAR